MAQPLVSDELWEIVEPLIPKVPRRYRYPGRKRIDDRLNAIGADVPEPVLGARFSSLEALSSRVR